MEFGASCYDAELQMFTDRPREPDPARLRFLRWLSEQHRLEHDALGSPMGEYAARALPERSAVG